ncbi:MAG: DCC1-like thiol-disulfide oxidoreductase family protein [Gemmatimonadota bacterium]
MTAPLATHGASTASPEAAGPILYFDGTCAFCARSVRFLLERDHRRRTLRFAPRAGAAGRALEARHPGLAEVSSLLWVEPDGARERVITYSTAALHAARTGDAPLEVSRYGDVLAPPLLFRRALWPELLAWQGEGCGKAVVRAHLDEASLHDWRPEALADVDTPEDYAALTR